jgi:ABC-2 type transport system permease protein
MTAAVAVTVRTSASLLGMKRLVGFGLLEIGPALIYLASSARVVSTELPERITAFAATLFFPLVVPVVTVVLAANALGGERRDGTLSFLVLRPIPRSAISAAKITGAATATIVLNAIGALALGLVHVLIGGSAALIPPLLVGAAVASLVYTAVFLPFGFLTERAVIVGLIFVFVFEGAIVTALSGLATLSPWRIGFSAFAGLLPEAVSAIHDVDTTIDAALGNVAPGMGGAVIKAAVLVFLSAARTTWLLRSRDLT